MITDSQKSKSENRNLKQTRNSKIETRQNSRLDSEKCRTPAGDKKLLKQLIRGGSRSNIPLKQGVNKISGSNLHVALGASGYRNGVEERRCFEFCTWFELRISNLEFLS
jgi:hypothetical protein